MIAPEATFAASCSCIAVRRASISSLEGRLPVVGKSNAFSSSELLKVSAAIAAAPPASSAPVRTIGATHFTFGRRIIVELLADVFVQTPSSPMNLKKA